MSGIIRVLIADDHAVVREGLQALIGAKPDMEVVDEAVDGVEVVTKACALRPDVILMDLVMPRKGGIEAIREIRASYPEARILVLTSFAEDELVFAAIQAGALGYLLKESSRQELLRAIRDVHQGRSYLHPSLTLKLIQRLDRMGKVRPDDEALSEREVEVLKLVARGLSNQEIAAELSISVRTAAKHVGAILDKLHLANRTQAALYALRRGMASLYRPDEA